MEEINFLSSAKKLCDVLPASASEVKRLRVLFSKESWAENDKTNFLQQLSSLLLRPTYTDKVAVHCTGLLLELLVFSIKTPKLEFDEVQVHEQVSNTLGLLVGNHPQVARYCLEYFTNHPSLTSGLNFPTEDVSKKKIRKTKGKSPGRSPKNAPALQKTLVQLLCQDRDYFTSHWDWGPLVHVCTDPLTESRWLAAHCLALVTEMPENQLNSFLKQLMTEDQMFEQLCKNRELLETQHPSMPYMVSGDKPASAISVRPTPTADELVVVCGVPLVKATESTSSSYQATTTAESIAMVPSVYVCLRQMAIAVLSGTPCLIQGPVGCGKTFLVQHMASVTERKLVKVQMGDQVDSKFLVGMYCCTSVPGEFLWKAGPLTSAMEEGHWLLLEDIDYAPQDVVSLLVPVLKNRTLVVPGHSKVLRAAPGFQLFASRRLVSSMGFWHSESRGHTEILKKLWYTITLPLLSEDEFLQMMLIKWPQLDTIKLRINNIFQILNKAPELGRGMRIYTIRDMFKWCSRIAKNFSIVSSDGGNQAFLSALDCFCWCVPDVQARLTLAAQIAEQLNVPSEKSNYFCQNYIPNIQISSTLVTVGRFSCKVKESPLEENYSALDVGCYEGRNVLQIANIKAEELSRPVSWYPVFAQTRQALVVLESIAMAVAHREPVLLVGETGTGKTSVVQYLAHITGQNLIVINMNQQSDSADLLGGYKPVDLKVILMPLRLEFEELFLETFSPTKNAKFLSHIMNCFAGSRWDDLLHLMVHVSTKAMQFLESSTVEDPKENLKLLHWQELSRKIGEQKSQVKQAKQTLIFSFIKGILVKAVEEGSWILLDEINLAENETLECLAGLLDNFSLTIQENGNDEEIKAHKDFRLFACMNPATDVGKKDLPVGVRNRFTEIFMGELENEEELFIMVSTYLHSLNLRNLMLESIVKLYLTARKAARNQLVDGTGHPPHFSLRTLCRALSFASTNPCGSVLRSLYEAFCLSFLTQLDLTSCQYMENLISSHLLGKEKVPLLKCRIPKPSEGNYLCFEGFWIHKGEREPHVTKHYILTPTVQKNLCNLARVVSARRHPVLLQGETSVGKTSLIEWLAEASGNVCIRVNNHEHTDLQEYVGSYVANSKGKLVFQEGVLVEAMRKGYWIILDELNLAATEVLEALNRVLDDNRELFISETQTVVKAHQNFMLFATQNPPGLYGGRKVLSRAFRNRFIELHFAEIPRVELEEILFQRCSLPRTYCKKMVAVMYDLQIRRRESMLFAGKHGYITLRDLFRWGDRYRLSSIPAEESHDWLQYLAEQGYMLLVGRVRREEEMEIISEVLQKHMKRTVDPMKLFSLDGTKEDYEPSLATADTLNYLLQRECLPFGFEHIVWTQNMRRLAVLVEQALEFREPVLLVGDTGCGKTTVCQLLSMLKEQNLFMVNCHNGSESADFLGCLRPVRSEAKQESGNFFEWVDGPLIKAMCEGGAFLVDEISLADDSVLERLNSVLEPGRTLLMAEKGGEVVKAEQSFCFMATMNPGGDYGKKELSRALRNRFTEIWCESYITTSDLIAIVDHNSSADVKSLSKVDPCFSLGQTISDFLAWFTDSDIGERYTISIRDILSWVQFINLSISSEHMSATESYINGACLVFLDALGSGRVSIGNDSLHQQFKSECLEFLKQQVGDLENLQNKPTTKEKCGDVITTETEFGIHPFYIAKGPNLNASSALQYSLTSPTPNANASRLLRAMQLPKPLLLEGPPGVGKTTLVECLAKASGHKLLRINLSEQTDISELFGADLPVEGGQAGHFAWRDGPVLQALKDGHWILLDELNLASQSVLEGLNACLDHRGEIFIPELDKSFLVPKGVTRIFGCQNPQKLGGSRKGLPRSFLNRFTQVYIEPLPAADLHFIACCVHPVLNPDMLKKMVLYNECLSKKYLDPSNAFGQVGGPWEFNLRDLFRWCQLIETFPNSSPGQFVQFLYADRMRSKQDRNVVLSLYTEVFGGPPCPVTPVCHVTCDWTQVGEVLLPRTGLRNASEEGPKYLLHYQKSPLSSFAKCIQMNWMAILVGPSDAGKTSLVQILATLTGHPLHILNMNSDMDTTELLGGFEQGDFLRKFHSISKETQQLVQQALWKMVSVHWEEKMEIIQAMLQVWAKHLKDLHRSMKTKEAKENNIGLILEKTQNLRNVLMLVKQASPPDSETLDDKLDHLNIQLQLIEEQFASTRNLRCEHTFEWVDSILVEALTNGYWLLLDNVNFCSASVLDRLNPLLEPDGTLVLTERGFLDGKVPIIKPHPDFRLILAMDPKNGEISQAMRNRGVEIYILGKCDGGGPDEWDQQVLLKSLGLTDINVVQQFNKVQEIVQATCSETSQLLLPDILKCAGIFMSHLSCGFSLSKSLSEACQVVYLHNLQDSDNKNVVLAQINDSLENSECKMDTSEDKSLALQYCQMVHHPSATEFQISSLLATGHSQAALLVCLLKTGLTAQQAGEDSLGLDDSYFLPSFFDMESLSEALHLAISMFMETSSPWDWLFRLHWLQTLVNEMYQTDDVKKTASCVTEQLRIQFTAKYTSPLAQNMLSILQRLDLNLGFHVDVQKLPYNLQSNAPLRERVFENNPLASRQYSSLSNKYQILGQLLSLIPEHVATPIRRTRHIDTSSQPKELFHLSVFFRILQQNLTSVLQSDDFFCSNETMEQVSHALGWFYPLWTTWRQCLQRSQSTLIDKLSMLWGWANKHSLPVIQNLHPNLLVELKQKSNLVSECLLLNENKLRKRMARILEAPLPLPSSVDAQLYQQTCILEQKLTLPNILSCEKASVHKILELRSSWFKTLMQAFSGCNAEKVLLKLKEIEESIEAYQSSTELPTTLPNHELDVQIQLVPILEPLKLRVLQEMIASSANTSISDLDSVATVQSRKDSFLSCPHSYFILSPSLLHSVSSVNVAKVLPEHLLNILEGKVNVPTVEFQRRLLFYGMPSSTTNHHNSKDNSLEQQRPLSLSHCCNTLLVQTFDAIPLGMLEEKCKQLNQLKNAMWQNVAFFSSPRTSEWYTSAQLVCQWYSQLLAGIVQLASSKEDCSKFMLADGEVPQDLIPRLTAIACVPDDCCTNLRTAYSLVRSLKSRLNGAMPMDQEEIYRFLGTAWLTVGYATTLIFVLRDPVDPVLKWSYKVDIFEQFLNKAETELAFRNWISYVSQGFGLSNWRSQDIPPWVTHLTSRISSLSEKMSKQKLKSAYRPECSEFEQLRASIEHLMNTEIDNSSITELCFKLTKDEQSHQKLFSIIQNKINSLTRFVNDMENKYKLYRDLTVPFSLGLLQMIYGLKILKDRNSNAFFSKQLTLKSATSPLEYYQKLVQFPFISSTYFDPCAYALFLTNLDTHVDYVSLNGSSGTAQDKPNTSLLLSGLLELHNHLILNADDKNGTICTEQQTQTIFCLMDFVLDKFSHLLKEEEDRKKELKAKDESFYQYQSHKSEVPEEELERNEIRQMFPKYDQEFDDQDEETQVVKEATKREEMSGLKPSDIYDIWQLHDRLVNAMSLAAKPGKAFRSTDFMRPFLLRYELLTARIDIHNLNNDELDSSLLGSHVLACHAKLMNLNSPTSKVPDIDFYFKPYPKESSKCQTLLKNLLENILKLFPLFPEHPALCKLQKITTRVLGFPVNRPLMVFLTGLEMILTTAQDWESSLHRGMELRQDLSKITELIIEWRKLEIKCWSSSLGKVNQEITVGVGKWWNFLYSVLKQTNWEETLEEINSTIIHFIEDSTLGDFKAKLHLLETFSHHCCLQPDGRLNKLFWVFTNVHHFYSQFLPSVDSKTASLRKPFEKQLKDFVKIAKWNDVNYFSIMQDVEKSHHTIYKCTKDYKKVLLQPVRQFLTPELSQSSKEPSTSWQFHLDLKQFIVPVTGFEESLPFEPSVKECELSKLLTSSRKLPRVCKKVFKASSLQDRIEDLNAFSGDIAETVLELENHDFDKEKDQDKRKTLYKNLHTRKRRALSDFFKMLHTLGFSYQKGLALMKLYKSSKLMLVPPLSDADLQILPVSEISAGCKEYYFKSASRFSLLQTLLESPSKVLELGIIQRCKGFASHLMHTIIEKQQKLVQEVKRFSQIKLLVSEIVKVNPGDTSLPIQSVTKNWADQLKKLLIQASASLEQFQLLLNCCPSQETDSPILLAPWMKAHPLAKSHKCDKLWTFTSDIILGSQKLLSDVKARLAKLQSGKQSCRLFSWQDLDVLEDCFAVLATVSDKFSVICSQDAERTFLTRSLDITVEDINRQAACFQRSLKKMRDYRTSTHDYDCDEVRIVFHKHLNKLFTQVLISAQQLSKLDTVGSGADPVSENSATEKIYCDVFHALDTLNLSRMESVLSQMVKLLCLSWDDDEDLHISLSLLQLCKPVLNQYLKLCEFYLVCAVGAQRASSKLLYMTLGVFCQLVQKGFCLPSDLEDDITQQQDQGVQFQEIEEGGLGDGEGTKDVSEKLESEDQLDQPNENGEQEEKNVQEEENGIEMSENFESQPQDVNTEEDEQKGSGDEDNQDDVQQKEMGQVDQPDPNQIDDKFWGSVSDDSDEEEEEKKEEKNNKTTEPLACDQEKSTPQMVAKEETEESSQEKQSDQKPLDLDDQEQEDQYEGEKLDSYNNCSPNQEPDDVEIPDDLQLDEGEANEEIEDEDVMQNTEGDTEKEEFVENPNEDPTETEEMEDEEPTPNEEDYDGLEQMEVEEELPSEDHVEDNQDEKTDLQQSTENCQSAPDESLNKGSKDKVLPSSVEETNPQESEKSNADEDPEERHGATDKTGVEGGQSSAIHEANEESDSPDTRQTLKRSQDKRRKTVPDYSQPVKRLKTRDASSNPEEQADTAPKQSDLYEHLPSDDCPHDAETIDLATAEQAENQTIEKGNEDSTMQQEDDITPEQDLCDRLPPIVNDSVSKSTTKEKNKSDGGSNEANDNEEADVKGDVIRTASVARGSESTIHTRHDLWSSYLAPGGASVEHVWNFKEGGLPLENAQLVWDQCNLRLTGLVQELCEQLRLLLEPTKTAKMKGDYRTGKRLNMKKIIPYIASQFRKDKIWLRRTKPSKREYQIVIAVDDSYSMTENNSYQMAFESLSVLSRALNILEAGELAVVSFGEETRLVHPLGQPLTDTVGGSILQKFSFSQRKTRIAHLLNYVTGLLSSCKERSFQTLQFRSITQLVVIISDGQGIYNEGNTVVNNAVRQALLRNIFLVFVILDNAQNQHSILDIQRTDFLPSGDVVYKSYMESFPFPFYVVLREISSLPVVLGEALKQWFELVTSGDK